MYKIFMLPPIAAYILVVSNLRKLAARSEVIYKLSELEPYLRLPAKNCDNGHSDGIRQTNRTT